jgi:hypothetical protein
MKKLSYISCSLSRELCRRESEILCCISLRYGYDRTLLEYRRRSALRDLVLEVLNDYENSEMSFMIRGRLKVMGLV